MEQESYLRRLSHSYQAVYRSLERPHIARRTVFVLLIVHSVLLAYSGYIHSPTLNEPGHLVAGLSHWKFGRFELYRVNPPLIKMIAALPVMAVGYEEEWSGFYEGPGARPESAMGEDFVTVNGERSFFLFMIARWTCIPFSWIGAIVCYLWARDMYGRPAGVLACTLWCFEPNILAHASLMTPDAGGTALGVAACYTFWKWLKTPTWTQAALTGIVLGLAELCKTTLILFYPLWPLLWIVYRWRDRSGMIARDWLRESGMLLLRMTIGLYILNLGYGFEGTGTQLKNFHFVSDLFTGDVSVEKSDDSAAKVLVPSPQSPSPSVNRFADIWLGVLPVPIPKNYLLGIDIQQQDFERYGHPSYLRGNWQEHGWWYYYLYAAAIKIPLGLWCLGLISLVFSIFYRADGFKMLRLRQFRDVLILLTPSLVIFCVASAKTGFSEHFRYVLPCFPFIFIWLGVVGCKIPYQLSRNYLDANHSTGKFKGVIGHRRCAKLAALSFPILLLWSFASSMWIYPHSLSYFNESIGGPLNGSKHLVGSNVDWGQDLRYLVDWIKDHAGGKPVFVSYYSYLDPEDLEISTFGVVPQLESIRFIGVPNAWYAVSSGLIRGVCWSATSTLDDPVVYNQNYFSSLRAVKPVAFAGYSIHIFGVVLDQRFEGKKY